MRWLQRLVRQRLERLDHRYRRQHRLQQVGPVLYVGREVYRGPAVQLHDGSRIVAGDLIGTLHFDNARLASIGEDNRHRIGLQFARMMRQSLRALAAQPDAPAVYHGITWMRAHGERVGFSSEPLRNGFTKWRLRLHFRLLTWAFSSVAGDGAAEQWEPRVFWLRREELLRNFGTPATAPAGAQSRCA